MIQICWKYFVISKLCWIFTTQCSHLCVYGSQSAHGNLCHCSAHWWLLWVHYPVISRQIFLFCLSSHLQSSNIYLFFFNDLSLFVHSWWSHLSRTMLRSCSDSPTSWPEDNFSEWVFSKIFLQGVWTCGCCLLISWDVGVDSGGGAGIPPRLREYLVNN